MQLSESLLKLLVKEIIEYLGLEGTSEDHPLQPSRPRQGHPKQVTQERAQIDKDALDAQVKERKIQEATEKAEHERFAHDMKKNDKLMCLLEERQKNEIKDLNKALTEFHKNFQKPETRREFDLNDPQALKKDRPARVSDDDPRCTISGMQKFMGEDLNHDQRMKFQKEQLREWSLQQQKDLKNALADQKLADDLYDKFRIELDRKIMEEQRKEEESRRAVCTATKNFNKIQLFPTTTGFGSSAASWVFVYNGSWLFTDLALEPVFYHYLSCSSSSSFCRGFSSFQPLHTTQRATWMLLAWLNYVCCDLALNVFITSK
ncbi:RIB43A-like with coiled-coils protein 2 isoform X2 [Motacilla alba alba]|uniref:RIB43A-like with coiled-coils protein 2 isoform X2 n=1 Tax=Motacilla alba alba TaxID=1094192 RepID=UPI0018D59797|nr:RIB43A-like with coiled-coils protein 2 isoform X2 [Motacilla alba alba]